jgi:putative ABC transport system ATP-binding protein
MLARWCLPGLHPCSRPPISGCSSPHTSSPCPRPPPIGPLLPPALTIESLAKRVRLPTSELTILEGIAFEIATGDSAAIVGASGSGKSTLLALMAGLDTPSDGRVLLDGRCRRWTKTGVRACAASVSASCSRTFQLLPSLTALENVMLPLELRGLAMPMSKRRRGRSSCEGRLGERLGHYPRSCPAASSSGWRWRARS